MVNIAAMPQRVVLGMPTEPPHVPSSTGRSVTITALDRCDHLVEERVFATSRSGRYATRCGAVVVSAGMAEEPGRPCPLCNPRPAPAQRPARRFAAVPGCAAMADQNQTDIDVAIRFMAQQPGGAERVLAIHRRLPDGRCRGCLTTATMWPCPVARFAMQAQQAWDHHGLDRGPQ